MQIKSPRKLIEVALPLEDINIASAREKSIRHGHPSTLHLWWARRPLAAARAVLFAQMVNDPGYETGKGFTRGVNKKDAALERERLFGIIRELVKWENTNNETVLESARAEIRKSWEETCRLNARHPQAAELFNPEKLPAFHDPFAGGGAIPLEAQRLGLESHASDLNPVAVLINKAMIEIPPRFSGRTPVGPMPAGEKQSKMHEDWSGARGLAEDVRRYGQWMREEAQKRIGVLYPEIEIENEMSANRPDLKSLVGKRLTVIAWMWARTVASPNPAYSKVHVPLASTFLLSSKPGKEAWVDPIVENGSYRFEVRTNAAGHGKPPKQSKDGTKISQGSFRCLMSDTPIKYEYVDDEANNGRMGTRLMAVVVEGERGRIYLSPTKAYENLARSAKPTWRPETPCRGTFASNALGRRYGFQNFSDYFTDRQLVALNTFSDLLGELRKRTLSDAKAANAHADSRSLAEGGSGAEAYSEALSVYLALGVDRAADAWSNLVGWRHQAEATRNTFARQAISMGWEFTESNPFSDSCGNWTGASIEWVAKSLIALPTGPQSFAIQADAQFQRISINKVVSTDPPYYDNIGYADLSDFFYVWARHNCRWLYPDLFATLASPKTDELIATQYRHESKDAANKFFLDGMTGAMKSIVRNSHPAFPTTIYYAFKQSETKATGTASTGWETFLEAFIRAGFALVGTWPIRTEKPGRMIEIDTNALASSIVLVGRARAEDAPSISRKDFIRELRDVLKDALEAMLGGEGNVSPIAPVDLAQAAIGPGMAVYSQYSAVLEASGDAMSVHTALTLINKQVDEALGGENFDPDTNFCLGWFQDLGWLAGEYGKANTLAQAKATSVAGAQQAGVIEAKGGKVRLLKPADYPAEWDPREDSRTPVWEALHQMIRSLNQGGESAAGALLARMPERSGDIRRLAFWLYTLCAERKKLPEDARNYNDLITSWHAIEAASHDVGLVGAQSRLDL